MKIFKHTYIFLLVFSFIFTTTTSWVCSAAERDAPSSKGVKKAHGGAGRADDEEPAEPKPRAVAHAVRFQWVPNFNFVFRGTPAEADEGGGPSSLELSTWHQAQAAQLSAAYEMVRKNCHVSRNVAVVMLSVVYRRGDRLLVRNIEIPQVFLSGFDVNDNTKGDKSGKKIKRQLPTVLCVKDNYPRASAYTAYLDDLKALFAKDMAENYVQNEDGTPRTEPSKKFQAEECHSERGIAVYLKDHLLSERSRLRTSLLKGIEPGQVVSLFINIASYRDMCGNCQYTLTTELRHGLLFINALSHILGKHCAIVVAQSGIAEYSGTTPGDSTRTHSVRFDPLRAPVELSSYDRYVLHMVNNSAAMAAAPAASRGGADEEGEEVEEEGEDG